jgi:hypothetical protein
LVVSVAVGVTVAVGVGVSLDVVLGVAVAACSCSLINFAPNALAYSTPPLLTKKTSCLSAPPGVKNSELIFWI